jgi:hypothetical protein
MLFPNCQDSKQYRQEMIKEQGLAKQESSRRFACPASFDYLPIYHLSVLRDQENKRMRV